MSKFDEVFKINADKYSLVTIERNQIDKLNEFLERLVKVKRTEFHHQVDGLSEFKRFYTGFLGELALEKFLNIKFVDWEIGDSSKFVVSDMKKVGLKIGIKTVNYGMFPVIFKTCYYPEIICVKMNDNEVQICGLATVNILHQYQSLEYIMDPRLRQKGSKTAFIGLDRLLTFSSISDLKTYSQ